MDWKSLPKKIPACGTVGDLVRELSKLPPELPIAANAGDEPGVKPVIFNAKYDDRHLSFEENDGMWD